MRKLGRSAKREGCYLVRRESRRESLRQRAARRETEKKRREENKEEYVRIDLYNNLGLIESLEEE